MWFLILDLQNNRSYEVEVEFSGERSSVIEQDQGILEHL
jgi:hypothetical protein